MWIFLESIFDVLTRKRASAGCREYEFEGKVDACVYTVILTWALMRLCSHVRIISDYQGVWIPLSIFVLTFNIFCTSLKKLLHGLDGVNLPDLEALLGFWQSRLGGKFVGFQLFVLSRSPTTLRLQSLLYGLYGLESAWLGEGPL